MAIQEAYKPIGQILANGYSTLLHKEFIIDTAEDVENLPSITDCLAGSNAIDASTGDIYMMNSLGEWNKIFGNTGGNSGGSSSSGSNDGSGIQLLHLHLNETDVTQTYVEESYSEILSIFKSGKLPCLWFGDGSLENGIGENFILPLAVMSSNGDDYFVIGFYYPVFKDMIGFTATTSNESMTMIPPDNGNNNGPGSQS